VPLGTISASPLLSECLADDDTFMVFADTTYNLEQD